MILMLMMSIPVNMSGCLGLCRLLPGSLDGTCPLVTIMMMVMVVVMLMMVMLAVMIVVMITMKLKADKVYLQYKGHTQVSPAALI